MPVPEGPGEVKITLEKGLLSSLGGEPQPASVERNLPIPGIRDYLKVTEVQSQSVIDAGGDIERLLVLRTTTSLKDPETLHRSVEIRLLPDCRERNPDRPTLCEARGIQEWQSAIRWTRRSSSCPNPSRSLASLATARTRPCTI